jgi:hypothetical protein
MDVVRQIFDDLGGATAIARGTGHAVQTVHDWLVKGTAEIPPWRRGAVLEFARKEGKLTTLPPECLEYLQSQARPARKQGKAA